MVISPCETPNCLPIHLVPSWGTFQVAHDHVSVCVLHFCSNQNVWSKNYNFRMCAFLLGDGKSLEWESNSCKMGEVEGQGVVEDNHFGSGSLRWLQVQSEGRCLVDTEGFQASSSWCTAEATMNFKRAWAHRNPKALSSYLINVRTHKSHSILLDHWKFGTNEYSGIE